MVVITVLPRDVWIFVSAEKKEWNKQRHVKVVEKAGHSAVSLLLNRTNSCQTMVYDVDN